jgi:hypothetical protein
MTDCKLRGAGAERRLAATVRFPEPIAAIAVVAEVPDGLASPLTRVAALDGAFDISAALSGPSRWLARDALRLTLFVDGRVYQAQGC